MDTRVKKVVNGYVNGCYQWILQWFLDRVNVKKSKKKTIVYNYLKFLCKVNPVNQK